LSQELERVYTINLGKALLSVDTHRAPRAINMIKEFARHHMKTSEIKIEEDLAHQIWARGVRSPPRKIRVRMNKTDEGYVLVSPYTEEKESKALSKKELKEASKKEKKDAAKVETDTAKVETDTAKVEKDTAKVETDAKKESKGIKKESKGIKKESKGIKKKSKNVKKKSK
jgi:large subunit ribosomal protein L31e